MNPNRSERFFELCHGLGPERETVTATPHRATRAGITACVSVPSEISVANLEKTPSSGFNP
jgi:hypothetical protein